MDGTQLVGLAQMYFTQSDYLVIQIGSVPPIYFLAELIRQGHMFTVKMFLVGWVT